MCCLHEGVCVLLYTLWGVLVPGYLHVNSSNPLSAEQGRSLTAIMYAGFVAWHFSCASPYLACANAFMLLLCSMACLAALPICKWLHYVWFPHPRLHWLSSVSLCVAFRVYLLCGLIVRKFSVLQCATLGARLSVDGAPGEVLGAVVYLGLAAGDEICYSSIACPLGLWDVSLCESCCFPTKWQCQLFMCALFLRCRALTVCDVYDLAAD